MLRLTEPNRAIYSSYGIVLIFQNSKETKRKKINPAFILDDFLF